jgi:hypothetical protein
VNSIDRKNGILCHPHVVGDDRHTATPRRLTLATMNKKPMDKWSVEEWRAFIQGKTELR